MQSVFVFLFSYFLELRKNQISEVQEDEIINGSEDGNPKVTSGLVTPAGVAAGNSKFEPIPREKPLRAAVVLLKNIQGLMTEVDNHKSLEAKKIVQESLGNLFFQARAINSKLQRFASQKRIQQTFIPKIFEIQSCLEGIKMSIPDKELDEESKSFPRLSNTIQQVERNDLWGIKKRKNISGTKIQKFQIQG